MPVAARARCSALPRGFCVGIDQGGPARQLRQLAHKCACAVGDDVLAPPELSRWVISTSPAKMMVRPWPTSPTLTRGSPAPYDRTTPKRRRRSISAGRQAGKHLVASCFHDRWRWHRHRYLLESLSRDERALGGRLSAVCAEAAGHEGAQIFGSSASCACPIALRSL